MPVAVIQDWIEPETDRSTTNYDAIGERLGQGDPIDGLIVHTAGYTGSGFRISEVWETRGHFDRFVADRLMPIVVEIGGDATPPTVTIYDLHSVVIPT